MTFEHQCPRDSYLVGRYERAMFDVMFSSSPTRIDYLQKAWGVDNFEFYWSCLKIAEHFHISPEEAAAMDTWWFDLTAAYLSAKGKNDARPKPSGGKRR